METIWGFKHLYNLRNTSLESRITLRTPSKLANLKNKFIILNC